MSERPRWRWWLFCFTLWLNWGRRWKWLDRLYSWSILPEWLATPEQIAASGEGRWPKTWDDSTEVRNA